MHQLNPKPAVGERVSAAYEACSGALRALEVASALTEEWNVDSHRLIVQAIELLRQTTAELQLMQREDAHLLNSDLVLPGRAKIDSRTD